MAVEQNIFGGEVARALGYSGSATNNEIRAVETGPWNSDPVTDPMWEVYRAMTCPDTTAYDVRVSVVPELTHGMH